MKIYFLGWALKFLSVFSKVIFLILAVKNLPSGVYSEYFFFSTLSVALSRFLSASGEEQIPIEIIKNKKDFPRAFVFVLYFGFFTLILSFLTFYLKNTVIFPSFFLAFSIAFAALVGGLIRINYPALFELSGNLPFIFFIAGFFLFNFKIYQEILIFLSFSYLVVSFSTLFLFCFLSKEIFNLKAFRYDISFATRLYKKWDLWLAKSFSNTITLFNLRYYVFVYYFFCSEKSDSLTYALSAGEVLWQFVMIVVNRKLSFYFREDISVKDVLADSKKMILTVPVLAIVFSILIFSTWQIIELTALKTFFTNFDIYIIVFASSSSVCFSSFSFYKVSCFYLEKNKEPVLKNSYIIMQILMIFIGCFCYIVTNYSLYVTLFLGSLANFFVPFLFINILIKKEGDKLGKVTK